MKDLLQNVLQTEENRDALLIGAEADFCNKNGQVIVRRVLKSLTESENAVMNRFQKLKTRLQTADLTQ